MGILMMMHNCGIQFNSSFNSSEFWQSSFLSFGLLWQLRFCPQESTVICCWPLFHP